MGINIIRKKKYLTFGQNNVLCLHEVQMAYFRGKIEKCTCNRIGSIGTIRKNNAIIPIWEEKIGKIKKKEKNNQKNISVLAGVPKRLPALMRAIKLQEKASRVNFDWDNVKHKMKLV